MKTLRELSTNPSHALELGKAAEHLVCADLMLQGYRAFLSDQGLPYDVVVDIDGRMIRVQVKATCFLREVNATGKNSRMAYSWHVRRRGKSGNQRLDGDHCEIVALVALDIRVVAYMAIGAIGQTVQLVKSEDHYVTQGRRGSGHDALEAYPFAGALLKCS